MMDMRRGSSLAAVVLLTAALLAGCSTVGDDGIATDQQPQQLAPVTDSSVTSDALPPIGGSDGSVQLANAAGASTTPTDQPGIPPAPGDTGDPGLTTASTGTTPPAAGQQGSFVSLNDVGAVPNAPGRDLSGSLSIEKLLGGWTVVSGAQQCRLNLTYTSMTGTGRYRASAPACEIPTLASVSSWQLAGTQVQLFNDSDTLIGALLLSGNRFIGTLTGGRAISMVG